MLSFRPVRAFRAGLFAGYPGGFPVALLVALLMALPVALLPAAGAHAADRTVQGGRLDWGIKSSFLGYVTGPIAQGSWGLTGGAATVGSQFRFHSATGAYDPDSGAFSAGFSGGVRFVGHQKSDGSYELDLTLSRPTVRISGGKGTLHADMVSKAKGSGKVTTSSQVPFASLNLSGIDMRGGSSPVALGNVPATLTTQGATAFAGYYTAGTALDPVSLSVDVAAAPSTTPPPPSSSSPEGEEKEKGARTPEESASAALREAAVDWGVRRTYREYVTGSIAQGKWTLGDGAQDGGALFRFPRGKGTYDAKTGTLDADFAGSVRFTGTRLDLTLSKVAVVVKDGKGTLFADVTDAAEGSPPREAVPLVTFAAGDFTPKDGLAALTETPAKLTAQGAKSFGSLYPAGTEMDPVSLAVTVDAKAKLPALPDLGSDTSTATATPTPSGTESAAATDAGTGPSASSAPSASSMGAGTYTAIGAGVALAAGLAVLVTRRRRAANAQGDASSSSGPADSSGPAGSSGSTGSPGPSDPS
ncbi:HtaA domain-containing protein [Streptomyces sp. NPDC059142]|uniref:HtaA domain-containing protein n=1 Tax=Streptomyces sp. NPDC059142 TaxID=3346739 RepID=UPI00367411CC